MISLLFKILADAAGFNRTMETELPATAKKGGKKAGTEAGTAFGKEFGGQVKGAILGAIGLGALTSAIKKAVSEATELAKQAASSGLGVEAVQELQRASELTGLSVDQLKASATKAPKEFTALMDYVRKTGGLNMNAAEVESLSGFADFTSFGWQGGKKALARILQFGLGQTLGAGSTVAGLASAAAEYGGATSSTATGGIAVQIGSIVADKLATASMRLGNMSDASYMRAIGVSQGSLSTPAGDFIQKLDEINKTLKEKL